jgi:hypothetical protein
LKKITYPPLALLNLTFGHDYTSKFLTVTMGFPLSYTLQNQNLKELLFQEVYQMLMSLQKSMEVKLTKFNILDVKQI